MPSLSWPDLTPATASALNGRVLAGSATGSLAAARTSPRGGLGIDES